jgi:hypothetical protein
VISPFERLFAFVGLGTGTVKEIRFFHQNNQGFNNQNGGFGFVP